MLPAFACFFCLMTSCSLLRPLSDEMGVAGGVAPQDDCIH